MADAPRYCDDWTIAEWRLWLARLWSIRLALERGWTIEDAMRQFNLYQFEFHDRTGRKGGAAVDWLLAINNGIAWAQGQLRRRKQSAGDCFQEVKDA